MGTNNATYFVKLGVRDALCRDLEKRRETLLSEVADLSTSALQVKRASVETIWKSYQNIQSELISLCGNAEDIPELLSDADFASHIYLDILTILEERNIKIEIKQELEDMEEGEDEIPENESDPNISLPQHTSSRPCPFRVIKSFVYRLLEVKPTQSQSPETIKKVVATAQVAYAELERLNIGVENVVHSLMLRKLDKETRDHFEKSAYKGAVPNHLSLMEFLTTHCDTLEQGKKKRRSFPEGKPDQRNNTLAKPSMRLCPVCPLGNRNHAIFNCPQISAKKWGVRLNLILRNGRCKKCLQVGHFSNVCKLKKECDICGKDDHHTILCKPSGPDDPIFCRICHSSSHSDINSCPTYLSMDVSERRSWASKYKMCFKCFDPCHWARSCPNVPFCRKCKGDHLTKSCTMDGANDSAATDRQSLGAMEKEGEPQTDDSPANKKMRLDDEARVTAE